MRIRTEMGGPGFDSPRLHQDSPGSMDYDVERAAERLLEDVRARVPAASAGVRSGEILVYVRLQREARDVPREWEGFPVTVRVIGNVRLA